jgi:glycerate-2-kinase
MRIKNMEALTNHGNRLGREHVAKIIDAGLDAVDPYYGVKRLVKLENNKIILDNREFEMSEDPHSGPAIYDLNNYDHIYVVGAAKGVQRAAVALEEILGDKLTGGHVIGKHGDDLLCKKIGVTLAGHPVPDRYCAEGCEKIFEFTKGITARDLVITISGSGCGSLMTWPAEGITVEEARAFTYMMQIEKGVPTSDLNTVRAHIDRMKGGKISRLFLPATLIHFSTADLAKMTTPVLRCTYTEMMKRNSFFPTLA